MASTTWLVVGLGNPGPPYAAHRHNVGKRVAETVARERGAAWKSRRMLRADVAECRVAPVSGESVRVVLATTRTYMNESGLTVAALLGWLKVKPDHLIVVHDEIDLDVGRLRVKYGGGDNGHNGLRSIRARLGTGDYYRVRLGVGRPAGTMPVEKWVLAGFAKADADEVSEVVERAAAAVTDLIAEGLTAVQQRYNS